MNFERNCHPAQGLDAGGAGASDTAAESLVRIEPLLLNRADAARLLSVSPRKLDQWADAGLIPRWKLDGVVRFTVDDLRQFVKNHHPTKGTAGEESRPHAQTRQLRNGFDARSV